MDPNKQGNTPSNPNVPWNMCDFSQLLSGNSQIPYNISQNPQYPSQIPATFFQNPPTPSPFPRNFGQFSPATYQSPGINPFMMQGRWPQQQHLSFGGGSNIPPQDTAAPTVPVPNEDDPEVPPSRREKSTWSLAEDEALISSYMEQSLDPVTGTYQKGGHFWKKVTAGYMKAHEANPNKVNVRNYTSVRSRWRWILLNITKWIGCLEAAKRRKSSGMNDEDVEMEAQAIWIQDEGNNAPFMMHHQMRMLKNYPRWEEIIINPMIPGNQPRTDSTSSGKRVRLDDNDEIGFNTPPHSVHHDSNETVEMSASMTRPPGVKKAKKKGKGKQVEDDVSTALVIAEEQTKMMDHKRRVRELDIFYMLQQNRANLTPDEAVLLQKLTKKVSDNLGDD